VHSRTPVRCSSASPKLRDGTLFRTPRSRACRPSICAAKLRWALTGPGRWRGGRRRTRRAHVSCRGGRGGRYAALGGGGRHVGRGGQPVVGRLRRRGEDGRGGGGGCAIGAVGEEQRRVGRCRTAPFVKRLAALSLMCPVCVGRFATPCLQLASASRGAFLIGQRLFLIIIETSLIGQFRCRTSFFAGRCARVGRARACLAAAARD